ncbi:hypothetical protein BLNAU_2108 [Blattamonas nauphoetae]|uniref:t-SNARE coiled-coil homology domain-containing protein n=1 Tax=Blattamonas nauphoetae TaxID=2049346 RepID=A0ABQ9YH43_9EUKA|nr:hypothetical protein BLNAU_2108 [Blattamonas nauphoetae]
MNTDPYPLIRSAYKQSALKIEEQFRHFQDLLKLGTADEISSLCQALKNEIANIRGDLVLVEESLDQAGNSFQLFSVSAEELAERKADLVETKARMETINSVVTGKQVEAVIVQKQKDHLLRNERRIHETGTNESDHLGTNHFAADETEYQMAELAQHDERLDHLHAGMTQLKEIGVVMSESLDESTREIDALSDEVEQNKSKLGVLNKTIDKLKKMKNKGQWAVVIGLCIFLLVLIIILLKVIF